MQPVLHYVIDQEGGRVQRLKQPDWPQLPAALDVGKLWRKHQFKGLEAANSLGQVIGSQLASAGISHVAAPVLDLSIDGADPVIGDRAFGTTPAEVIPLATAFIDGVTRSGVTPIVKHIPGMGRADIDSHQSLPVVGWFSFRCKQRKCKLPKGYRRSHHINGYKLK